MITPLILSLLSSPIIAEAAPSPERARARHNSPQQGTYAPEFTVNRLRDGAPVSLSGLIGPRPVVLIFGSYT
jgi:hypothetical protein